MKHRHFFILLVGAISILWPSLAMAWMRLPCPDPEVVQRAELIVVAHIKEGSLVYFPHAVAPNGGGASWGYHGVLVITEKVKGKPLAEQIPIIIHYGLTPVIGGYVKNEHMWINERAIQSDHPKDIIEIFDTADFNGAVTDDIRQDHLWFLRGHNWYKDGPDERDDTTTAPGIWDPEDIQPLELKPYFQAFLTEHPVPQITQLASEHSPVGVRAQLYLSHLKMEAALKEPDLTKRADLLLPFFLFTDKKDVGPTQHEASTNLWLHCGQAGAALLVPIFEDVRYQAMKPDIMIVWLNCEYRGAAAISVDLLRSENQSWRLHTPVDKNLWFETNPEHSLTEAQGNSEQRIELALMILQHVPNIHAKLVVEETKKLWTDMQITTISDKVVKRCDDTLVAIEKKQEAKQN